MQKAGRCWRGRMLGLRRQMRLPRRARSSRGHKRRLRRERGLVLGAWGMGFCRRQRASRAYFPPSDSLRLLYARLARQGGLSALLRSWQAAAQQAAPLPVAWGLVATHRFLATRGMRKPQSKSKRTEVRRYKTSAPTATAKLFFTERPA
jgi:hypothetical protein